MNVLALFVILFCFVMVYAFIFLYQVWSPVLATMTPSLSAFINETNSSDPALATQKANAFAQLQNVRNVWRYWPFVLLLFLGIWIIAATQKKEPMYAYGG
jgi:hypothetical protein